jgi:histidine ammonia-lyase
MHMAAIALVAMGEGRAELDGVDLTGAEALARAGIAPMRLGVKDALTVISANGVSIGHGALVVDRAARVIEFAELAAAISFEAAGANLSVIEPAVAAAKPVAGQAVSAARLRGWLDGSGLCAAGAAASVQDPLSFRVVPQVHGATREVLRFATEAVAAELAAMDDNPLVAVEAGTMTSNGNFHPMLLALAIDALRPALAHVGQLADRRMGNLWDRIVADPANLAPENLERMARHGSPLLRYSGAARSAELTSLAGPVTLEIAPLDVGVEDHATNAPLAVRRTEDALATLEDVLAVEILTATAVIALRAEGSAAMAPGTSTALQVVVGVIDELPHAPAGEVHRLVTARLVDLVTRRMETAEA